MQQPVQIEKWRAHINPAALQITWIAFCPVTPTTQTSHKKKSNAQSEIRRTVALQVIKATNLISINEDMGT